MNNTLPHILLERLHDILGDEYPGVMDAFSHERVGSFRINTLRSNDAEVLDELDPKCIKVSLFDREHHIYTFTRNQEYALKGTRAFYDGKIYLQSIASMLPVIALDPQEGERILDVCAAPGSKTTQMAMMMGNTGEITALEQNQIRYDKLMYNTRLQGATSIHGRKIDATKFLSEDTTLYDRILLDAPCSAEGRISLQHEKSYGFWSIENIRKKAEIQYQFISLAVERLQIGGTLVYSTCTLAPEENEGVLHRVLMEHPELSLESIHIGFDEKSWWQTGLTSWEGVEYGEDMKKAVRILPSAETEGFFMGKVVKKKIGDYL